MKLIKLTSILVIFIITATLSDIKNDFDKWKIDFKNVALKNNISEKTFDLVMNDTKFLSDVIKYDRFQPEFYEETKTYISKRT